MRFAARAFAVNGGIGDRVADARLIIIVCLVCHDRAKDIVEFGGAVAADPAGVVTRHGCAGGLAYMSEIVAAGFVGK